MARFLRIGVAAAIVPALVLAASMAGRATDLSMTPIYKARPSTEWALADRWTIASGIDAATDEPLPTQAAGSGRHAWSTGAGYTMLARWGLKGEYVYVNVLDALPYDPPTGTTTIAKTNGSRRDRALKVGTGF